MTLVYTSSMQEFFDDVDRGIIEDLVLQGMRDARVIGGGPSEIDSWADSLPEVARTLQYDRNLLIEDAGVAIELTIGLQGQRIDFVVSGSNSGGRRQMIITELKGWRDATTTQLDGKVNTWLGHSYRDLDHPSRQALTYSRILKDNNVEVYEKGVEVHPVAFLHRFTNHEMIRDSRYEYYFAEAPVFIKDERHLFREFIWSKVEVGDPGQKIIRDVDSSERRPSKQLADALTSMLTGNKFFTLITEQKLAYEVILYAVERGISRQKEIDRMPAPTVHKTSEVPSVTVLSQSIKEEDSVRNKQVIIIEGGAGTGKSVVAVRLLVEMIKQRKNSKYISKNAAPREVYQRRLGGNEFRRIRYLFGGTGSYSNSKPDEFDCLIVDEAHRMTRLSGFYGNEGENQVMEVVKAAKTCVFFIDEDQRVHIKDFGTINEIKKQAAEFGADVQKFDLVTQFRCNGSHGYLSWVKHTIGIRETEYHSLEGIDFDFRIIESAKELQELIIEKNQETGTTARLVAGYCWSWRSKRDTSQYDFDFDDGFRAQWNLKVQGQAWLAYSESINQVGCIHTCQGLEVDYIGVIIGNDLLMVDGNLETNVDARASDDYSVRGGKAAIERGEITEADLDKIIRNTYGVLMSRAFKGCYVYCVNPEVAEYLKGRIGSP